MPVARLRRDAGAVIAAWVLSTCAAVALAGSVYRIPIQVEDALEVIVRNSSSPSIVAVYIDGLHNSHTMLRPLREVRTKILLAAAASLGGRYHLAFRGYHAALAVLLVALFAYLVPIRTWKDVAALGCGFCILTGMQSFYGLMAEAYPVNHFLQIALYGLAIVALARGRPSWIRDVLAIGALLVAMFTLESGALLLLIAVAGYAMGYRGLSRWGLGGLVLVTLGYVVLRFVYLGMDIEQLDARATQFGVEVLSPAERDERFGGNFAPLYLYNVAAAALSVLLSQPDEGQWTILVAWQSGDVPPVFWVALLSSMAATALVVWYVTGRDVTGRRRWRVPVPFIFLVVLAGSAAMSFRYPKPEIMSLAGVLYALVCVAALQELLGRSWPRKTAAAIAVALLVFSGAWAIRTAGLQFRLRQAGFNARGGWAFVLSPAARDEWPEDPRTLALVSQLKHEALTHRGIAATALPAIQERWLGED